MLALSKHQHAALVELAKRDETETLDVAAALGLGQHVMSALLFVMRDRGLVSVTKKGFKTGWKHAAWKLTASGRAAAEASHG